MNTECSRIREALHTHYDENLKIPQDLENHISTCAGCKEYWAALSSLGESLAEEIDGKCKQMPPPDFGVIYGKRKQQRHNYVIPVIWGIAAVMVFSLGIFITSLVSIHQKKAEYISSDVRLFVKDIFSRPILYDDMLTSMNGNGVSGWFDTDLFGEDTANGDLVDMGVEFFD